MRRYLNFLQVSAQANSLISPAEFAQIEGITEADFMVQQ
jgi:hypothetical protein